MNLLFEHFSPSTTERVDYENLVLSEIRGICDMTYVDWVISQRLNGDPNTRHAITSLLNDEHLQGLTSDISRNTVSNETVPICFKDFLRIPAIILASEEDFI